MLRSLACKVCLLKRNGQLLQQQRSILHHSLLNQSPAVKQKMLRDSLALRKKMSWMPLWDKLQCNWSKIRSVVAVLSPGVSLCAPSRVMNPSKVNSLCKDTRCKDKFDVRTTPLVTNHCILTAVVPLSTDNLM